MLKLMQLAGFGSGGGGTDATPDAIDFDDIADTAPDAAAATNIVTVSGIDTTITLRLTLTTNMTGQRVVSIYRNGAFVAQGSSGTTLDVSVTNGQTLQYAFTNVQDNSTWSGTATVSNLTTGGTVLDTFGYTLIDTGSGGVGVDVVVLF